MITKIKTYKAEWASDEAKAWKDETEDVWIRYFKIRSEESDYRRYTTDDIRTLHECIAINLYGITETFCTKAYRSTCLWDHFSEEQRSFAVSVREKMDEISGCKGQIEMQVVPIIARMKKHLRKANKKTGKFIVFRINDLNRQPVFLECHLVTMKATMETYSCWEGYLAGNHLPPCIICYPKNGFLISKNAANNIDLNDIEFRESPSSRNANEKNDTNKITDDPVYMDPFGETPSSGKEKEKKRSTNNNNTNKITNDPVYMDPSAAICSPSWACTKFAYGAAEAGYKYYELHLKGEDLSCSWLMSFIAKKEAMTIDERRNSDQQRCCRGSVIKAVVLSALWNCGLSGPQVASLAWLTWCLAQKEELLPADIVGYVIVCHNLYFHIVTPEASNDILNAIKTEIQEQREHIVANSREFLDAKSSWMQDENARSEYNKFRQQAIEDTEQLGSNQVADQYDRIMLAVTYMDAEIVFNMISLTRSEIRFSKNDATLDVLFNSQLDVHPRAVDPMNRISEAKENDGQIVTYNPLQTMLDLTRRYTHGEIKIEKEFLDNIRTCLKDFQMITRIEVAIIKKDIAKQTQDHQLRKTFAAINNDEAYRLRTVFEDAPFGTLNLAYKFGEAYGDTSIRNLANWGEVIKLDADNECEKEKVSSKTQKRNFKESYIQSIFGERFEQKMTDLKKEIKKFNQPQTNNEKLSFPNDSLYIYYHQRKHKKDSQLFFNKFQPGNQKIEDEDALQHYFNDARDYIFTDANYRSSPISQDGNFIGDIYGDKTGFYKGVLKCKYDAEKGKKVGTRWIATYFPRRFKINAV